MTSPTVIRRSLLLGGLAALGGALFVPFARAAAPTPVPHLAWSLPLGAGLLTLVGAWAGCRLADALPLPMPWLRAFEHRTRLPSMPVGPLVHVVVCGTLLGLAGAVLSRFSQLPPNLGTLAQRLATTLFAAVVPEVVVHLVPVSLLLRLRVPVSLTLGLSSALFAALHGVPVGLQPGQAVVVIGLNVTLSAWTGWLYVSSGLESAMVGHAVAHAVVLAIR